MLLAAGLAWPIVMLAGSVGLLVAAAVIAVVGVWATGVYVTRTGEDDPGPVVIDEVAGQWLTLVVCPLDPVWWLVGFVAFRVADIAKPWPASWIDRRMHSPTGVMLDDIVAGAYAAVLVWGMSAVITAIPQP